MAGEIESQVRNIDVTKAILSQDIVEKGSTVDKHGGLGYLRDSLRAVLRKHGNMNPDDALRLAAEGISNIPERDVKDARAMLLSMIKDGCTVETAGFTASEKKIMERVIADTHGYNQGTTIAA